MNGKTLCISVYGTLQVYVHANESDNTVIQHTIEKHDFRVAALQEKKCIQQR